MLQDNHNLELSDKSAVKRLKTMTLSSKSSTTFKTGHLVSHLAGNSSEVNNHILKSYSIKIFETVLPRTSNLYSADTKQRANKF